MTHTAARSDRPVRSTACLDAPLSRWLCPVKRILVLPHRVVLFSGQGVMIAAPGAAHVAHAGGLVRRFRGARKAPHRAVEGSAP